MTPASIPLPERYEWRGALGAGAQGSVGRVWDCVRGEEVAVKVLQGLSGDARRRFHRELAALRALDHPGVVRLIDAGEVGDAAWIAMERVDGAPFPGAPTPVHWPELRRPLLTLLGALARVHDAGIVHRDLKPANVLVRPDGTAVVLDFGLARGEVAGPSMTRAGALLGTPRYWSPEQAAGARADARSDLYAVGVMAWDIKNQKDKTR